MKKILLQACLLFTLQPIFAQNEITKANDCYNKFDYQCAIDNYLLSISNKTYKESDLYNVQFRISYGYSKLGQLDKSNEYLLKAIASNPDYIYSYWGLADNYYDQKKYDDAITYYVKAKDKTNDNSIKEELTWWIANTYFDNKNYTIAITEFKKILSREGMLYKTEAYIGDAFYSLKKYDSAILYYNRALNYYKATDSTTKFVKCAIGKSYRELGKYKEAEQYLSEAIALDAKYGLPVWEKGILFASKKEYASAIEWYKKALPFYTAKPKDSYTLCGNISACYQFTNNFTEAVNWEIKRRAFSENKYIEYRKIASMQYGKLNKPKEAEKTCIEAIDQYIVEPADKITLLTKEEYVKLNAIAGKISLEKKDTALAIKYFETALKTGKTNFEANAGMLAISWARKKETDYKKYLSNIYKSTYDTLISSKKDIANLYGRAAHADAYINKYAYYSSDVYSALKFDSLQKEAVMLWPVVLTNNKYDLGTFRKPCLSVLNQAIKYYSNDKPYLSDLYNTKAVMLESSDTGAIHIALKEAVKANPENIKAWENLLKYYGSYNNETGAVMADKLIAILKKQKDNASTAAAYVYKGDFLWRLNKKADAKTAWQEALVWDANNTTAKERNKMQ